MGGGGPGKAVTGRSQIVSTSEISQGTSPMSSRSGSVDKVSSAICSPGPLLRVRNCCTSLSRAIIP